VRVIGVANQRRVIAVDLQADRVLALPLSCTTHEHHQQQQLTFAVRDGRSRARFNNSESVLSTGWAERCGHRLVTIILSSLNQFKKIHFKIPDNTKLPPHLAYLIHACETLMSAKQAIGDKLHVNYTVATYLRRGGGC